MKRSPGLAVAAAGVVLGVARKLAPHQRTPMGAAIDEGMYRTALVAIDNNGFRQGR
jgi:hypothetical protein